MRVAFELQGEQAQLPANAEFRHHLFQLYRPGPEMPPVWQRESAQPFAEADVPAGTYTLQVHTLGTVNGAAVALAPAVSGDVVVAEPGTGEPRYYFKPTGFSYVVAP